MEEKQFFAWIEGKGFHLTDPQKRAVLHDKGPLLLLAVPGAGKTTVLTVRLAYLILVKGIDPKGILCLTFGRMAAKEMRERFYRNFGDRIREKVHFSTIHSFAFQMVKAVFQDQEAEFRLIEEQTGTETKSTILRRLYQQVNLAVPNEEQLDELQNAICYVKNRIIEPAQLQNSPVQNFPVIYDAYEEHKRNHFPRLIDYDDMLSMAYTALRGNADLLAAYRKQVDYILTDESQDTSLLQHKIMELLAKPKNNIFIVGDDDQSIFGFRAAEPGYLLEFPKVFAEAQVFRMEENFRSTPQIVEAVCRFIRLNKIRFDKEMFTHNSVGAAVLIRQFVKEEEQYEYLLQEVQKEKMLSQVAILFRNNISVICLALELDTGGIPFYVRESGKERFFRHWVVNDILNFLRFSYNDKSLGVFEKIWPKIDSPINKAQLEYLKGIAIDRSIFDILSEQTNLPSQRKKEYLSLKEKFRVLNSLTPQESIQYIRNDLNYNQAVKRICDNLGFAKEYMDYLLGILEFIAGREATLPDFANRLRYLEGLIKSSHQNKGIEAVTLSTIHSAKGLEWDKVYMVDLVEGIIPDRQAVEPLENTVVSIEEERRLFYVGMTRAKRQLTLCAANIYFQKPVSTSQFVRAVSLLMDGNDPAVEPAHDSFTAGLVVVHKIYGEGVITSERDNILIVRFNNGTVRSFMREICEKRKLLRAK
ncbi:MAG: ATP-dependent helicase [Desulfitobacteriaceae bacterium]